MVFPSNYETLLNNKMSIHVGGANFVKKQINIIYFIYILVFLFGLLPVASIYLQPRIEMASIDKQLEAGNEPTAKDQIKSLLQQNISDKKKWEIIQKYMIDGDLAHRFDVYIGPSITTWPNPDNPNVFTAEEAIPYLEEYIEDGPVDGYMQSAAKQLAIYYQQQGNSEKADQILVKASVRAISSAEDFYVTDLFMKRVKIALETNNFSKAESIIEELKEQAKQKNTTNADLQTIIPLLEIEKLLHEGKFIQAHEKLNQDVVTLKKQWNEENEKYREMAEQAGQQPPEDLQFENGVFTSELLSIKHQLEQAIKLRNTNLASIEGRITKSNGMPMSGVGVFLRNEASVNMSVGRDERHQTLTDENGFYQITGVIPGKYQIHLGLTQAQVDDWAWAMPKDQWIDITGDRKITYNMKFNPLIEIHEPVNYKEIRSKEVRFKWEKVSDADYYDLNLCLEFDNGSTCSSIETNIKQNEFTIPFEELYDKKTGIMFSGDGSQIETVEPGSLLGFANSNGEFSWYVRAYDKDDSVITQSNGYTLNKRLLDKAPIFYLKERELTKADQLLLDRKIPEAFELYKQTVKENPNDTHSQRMVTRLSEFVKDIEGK